MLDIVRSLFSDMGINSMLFTLTERTQLLVEADRCTMYIVDRLRKEMWSLHGAVQIRIPLEHGIAGECATSGEIINIPDAYLDPRFNQEVDKKSGYKTKTILCMPVFDSNNEVIGVLQLINKSHSELFSHNDEDLLNSFLSIIGPILATSQIFSQRNSTVTQEAEFKQKEIVKRSSDVQRNLQTIKDADLDEENEDGNW